MKFSETDRFRLTYDPSDGRDEQVQALKAEVRDLKRRIREARRDLERRGAIKGSPSEVLLDLRKPLPKRWQKRRGVR